MATPSAGRFSSGRGVGRAQSTRLEWRSQEKNSVSLSTAILSVAPTRHVAEERDAIDVVACFLYYEL